MSAEIEAIQAKSESWNVRLIGHHDLNGHGDGMQLLKNGRYDNVPIDIVTSRKKTVNVERFYNSERLRPNFESFEMTPLFIMTSESI